MAQCAKVAKSHTQRQTEANTKTNELNVQADAQQKRWKDGIH